MTQIKNKELIFFDLVYTRFSQRMDNVKGMYEELLDTPFDYSENETINVDYDNLEYVTSKRT